MVTLDEDPGEHTLALGNTKPALFPYLNMPWVDFIVFCGAFVMAFVNKPIFCLPVAIAFAAAVRLYKKDYFAGRKFVCWLSTSARHLGAASVGGTYITPAAIYRPGTYRGTLR